LGQVIWYSLPVFTVICVNCEVLNLSHYKQAISETWWLCIWWFDDCIFVKYAKHSVNLPNKQGYLSSSGFLSSSFGTLLLNQSSAFASFLPTRSRSHASKKQEWKKMKYKGKNLVPNCTCKPILSNGREKNCTVRHSLIQLDHLMP